MRQPECLGKNTEKCRTFSIPIEKEATKIDKEGSESVVTISYKTEFIDSARLMASSLSNHVNIFAEGIFKIKCKDCDWFHDYKTVKDENVIKYKLPSCNENYSSNIKIATQKHI